MMEGIWRKVRRGAGLLVMMVFATGAAAQSAVAVTEGRIETEALRQYDGAPEALRLEGEGFDWQKKLLYETPTTSVFHVTFASPVETNYEVNNTVHGELYLPKVAAGEKVPGVLVLHMLNEPRFTAERMVARTLAEQGFAAMVMKMAYYGERRPPDPPKVRMLTANLDHSVGAMRQSVLDARRTVQWMAHQPEIDGERLGLVGISLGAIMGGIVAGVEPALGKYVFLLGGGDMAKILWESPYTRDTAQRFAKRMGLTYEEFKARLDLVDPVRHAANVRREGILMVNARADEVIPRSATDAWWEALGRPEIYWIDGGHYAALLHVPELLRRTVAHLAGPWPEAVGGAVETAVKTHGKARGES